MLKENSLENNKLGKGLSSLLGNRNLSIINNKNNEENNKSSELSIDLIIANNKQPRKNFKDDSINELVQSIKKYGILQPIIVRKIKDSDKYEIIAGERRFRSAKIAGLKTIPATIMNFDDKDSFSLSIIENIQRENLNAIEEANAYNELIEKYNYTQQEISNTVGKSRSHIANLLRLLVLPEIVKNYLIEGKIEMGHARALINCDFAEEIIDHIVENKLSVREVEKLVKDGKNNCDVKIPNKKSTENADFIDGYIRDKIKNLETKLSLKCNVNYNKKNKNYTFNVKFSSYDELNKFINNL